MKTKFIVVVILFLSLMFITTKEQADTIIIYSSLEQFRGEELNLQLQEKFPDINTKVMYIPTGKAAAKIALEGVRTEADMVVGLETSYLKKVSDSLQPLPNISKLNYLPEFNENIIGSNYVIWERQAGAFVINMEVIEKYDLDIPTTYEDLLDEQYKGLIAMPDPKSSGTGYFFLKNRVNELGLEGALAYFDKLEANVKQFTESGSGPIKLLNQREVAVGLALTFQAVNEINSGNPLKIVMPNDGSPFSLTGTALLKGRETDEDIMTIYDFIINDFIKYDKDHFSPEGIFENQIISIENYPSEINYANMIGIEDINEKEELLDLWNH